MPDFLSEGLKRLFAAAKPAEAGEKQRMRLGLLEAWVSIGGNIILFVLKYLIGVFTRSIAIIADSFHTLSDVVTSIVVLFGFRMSSKGPDKEHPYGHGRIETIATLIIAILLVMTGVEFIRSSYDRLLHPVRVGGGWWVVAVLALSGIFKEWMARFSFNLGKEINSTTLKADGWHHRSDAIASLLVAAGNAVTVWGLNWIDPILGFAVSLLIIYTGFDLARGSANTLVGTSPPVSVLENISSLASSVAGVKAVHGVQVHEYGIIKEISLHVVVDERLDLLSAHKVAASVEKKVADTLQAQVVVHVDPRTEGED